MAFYVDHMLKQNWMFKRNWKQIFKVIIANFTKHDILTLTAALAFYTALSLGPLLLLMVLLLGWLKAGSVQSLLTQINLLMGSKATEAVRMIIQSASQKNASKDIAGFVGIVTLLFSASGVFSQLDLSINIIWETAKLKAKSGGIMSLVRSKM